MKVKPNINPSVSAWASRPTWQGWEVILLCLGGEPDAYRRNQSDGLPPDLREGFNETAWFAAKDETARELNRAIVAGLLIPRRGPEGFSSAPNDQWAGELGDWFLVEHALDWFTADEVVQWAAPLFEHFPFEAGQEPEQEKPLLETERERLLKILLGMALDKYGYVPGQKRNSATGENNGSIHAALQQHGLNVDADTIRKYLQEAAERNPDAT